MKEVAKKFVPFGGYDVPEEVIERILRFCDFKAIHALGKVSQGIRHAISYSRPDLHITSFDVEFYSTKIICEIRSDDNFLKVQYRKHRKGCMVKRLEPCSKKEHFVRKDFHIAFSQDNFGFFAFQASLVKYFRLNFHFYKEDQKDEDVGILACNFLKNAIHALHYRQVLFQVRRFSMNFTHDSQAMRLLKYFDPNCLKKLELRKRYLPSFERIGKNSFPRMIQWKKSTELNLGDSVYGGLVEDLLHFKKSSKVRMEEITLGGLIQMKNVFLSSPGFEIFELKLIFFNENQFFELLGPPLLYPEGVRGTWLFGDQEAKRILSISLSSTSNIISFRRENWAEIENTFSSVSTMKYILEEDEKRFKDIVSRKSIFAMHFSETFKNKLFTMHISVNINNARLSIQFDTNPSIKRTFTYSHHKNGCICGLNKETKLMEGQDFVYVMTKDLEDLVNDQRSPMRYLRIHLHLETAIGFNNVNELQDVISNKFLLEFKRILSSRDELIQVKSFDMNPVSQDQLLLILPYLDPDYLEAISLDSQNQRKTRQFSTETLRLEIEKLPVQMRKLILDLPPSVEFSSILPLLPSKFFESLKDDSEDEPIYLEIDEVVKVDQWKNAKSLTIENLIISTSICNFAHFSSVEVILESISFEDLNYLKRLLLSTNTISFQIGYINFADHSLNNSVSTFPYQIFGQPQTVYKEYDTFLVKQWYIPVPKKKEDVVISYRSDKQFRFWRADSRYRKSQEKIKCDWTGLILFANVFPVIMEHILRMADFRSILTLRKVCRDLRNFIDDTRIQYPPRKLSISVVINSIETYFGYIGDLIHIYYKGDDDGCILVREKNEEERQKRNWKKNPFVLSSVKNVDYFTVFFKDLDIVFGHPKSIVEEFSIELPCLIEEQTEIGHQFLARLKEYLSSRRHKISVEKLTLKILLQNEIMGILPSIDPDKLKIIELKNQREQKGRLDIREVIKLEQWKKAKELMLNDFVISMPIQNLIHFSKVNGCVETITVSDLLVLKNTCLEPSKEFSLECEIFDLEDLNATFGRQLVEINDEGTRIRKWFFRIPNESQEVVQLVIIMESSSLKFSRTPVSSIPQNGTILN